MKLFWFLGKIVKMEKYADSVEQVTLIKFMKDEGSYIHLDEPIFEVESHKGTQIINSPFNGKIQKFLVEID